ncbi:MAG: HxlR family transcriptional regulator [Devosia sp.]|uniref:winged helix-turn-helix transcriptional regulator n=1 Tax=Devosia sp. TaxID=1871048 RepID=UPI00261F59C8|nr:helix-turn-helix domain-containing protein [Devosia sp.]MDB5536829.1 HxlR family transcriptional regulator [Devosia sp.]MDB5586292.1 HxlR family transcriptional regulator [Devosia sp.]
MSGSILGLSADEALEGAANCKAIGQIIERIGDKWTVLVVGCLSHGPMRFTVIQRTVPGVSHRMLTLTLRGLERDGLVKRTAFATIPPRVDYELTEAGQSLKEPLEVLAKWARDWQPRIEAAQIEHDVKAA